MTPDQIEAEREAAKPSFEDFHGPFVTDHRPFRWSYYRHHVAANFEDDGSGEDFTDEWRAWMAAWLARAESACAQAEVLEHALDAAVSHIDDLITDRPALAEQSWRRYNAALGAARRAMQDFQPGPIETPEDSD